jgi:hypothetical protein
VIFFADTTVNGNVNVVIKNIIIVIFIFLDTGCTKSMILKQFTNKKQQTKLSKENTIKYETYGSECHSSMTASVGFKMIEFEQQKNQTIEYKSKFQAGTQTTRFLIKMNHNISHLKVLQRTTPSGLGVLASA